MKQIFFENRQAKLIDVPDPKPKENWALIKIHTAPMCTEYKGFIGGGSGNYLGHEAAGEVIEIAQPSRVKVGDRVVVMPQFPCGTCDLCVSGEFIHCEQNHNFTEFNGSPNGVATMAQYILKPDWLLPKIPDGVSYDLASLACCALGPSFGALQNMGVSAIDTILITGLGPVGLGGVVNAIFRGATVIGMDGNEYRADLAKKMGAIAVLDPNDQNNLEQIRDLTNGSGVDFALDCSGNVHAERFCIDATKRKGKVTFVGECGSDLTIKANRDMIRKGLTIMGSWHYNLNYFPMVTKVIQNSPLLDLLVSHVFPMTDAQLAFETLADQQTGKVILKPWE